MFQGNENKSLKSTNSTAFVLRDRRLPTLFDFLFVVAALLNAGGWVGLFYQPGPYDEITHAFTTFSITLALSFLVYLPMLNLFRHHRWLYILTIASFGIAIGALWEIFEWLTGVINELDDTIVDLMMDTIGALAAATLSLWALQERTHPKSTNPEPPAGGS
jgi:VanZ family protein